MADFYTEQAKWLRKCRKASRVGFITVMLLR